jgi:hypothetical protein
MPVDDDEEGFPDDQVVYHDEEHLQKLFQLYTRPEEVRNIFTVRKVDALTYISSGSCIHALTNGFTSGY